MEGGMKIEGMMVRAKPDLGPWARFILEELIKEGGECEQERVREHGGRAGAVSAVQGIYAEHDQVREPCA